jgi:hypothetical protein
MSQTLTAEQAIERFSDFDFGTQSRIQSRSVSSPAVIAAVAREFLQEGFSQGWYFDADWTWHQVDGEPPRSVDAMMAQYQEGVIEPMDGKRARELRDTFLKFSTPEHAPLIRGLYAAGLSIDADGNVHGA